MVPVARESTGLGREGQLVTIKGSSLLGTQTALPVTYSGAVGNPFQAERQTTTWKLEDPKLKPRLFPSSSMDGEGLQ